MSKLLFVVFGLLFGSVGVGMAGYSGYQVLCWYETKNWVQHPGKVDALDLRVNHDEGTSYGVDCTYHYTVGGQKYSGDSPSFYSASDNLGSFQQDLHRRLVVAKQHDSLQVWVDPDDPSRSVLDRSFRCGFFSFSQLFGLVFGSIGLSVVTHGGSQKVPEVRSGVLHVQSVHRSTRAVARTLMLFYASLALFACPVALINIYAGHVAGWGALLWAGIVVSVFFVARYVRRKHPVAGLLLMPTGSASRSEQPRIELPASWQGPVEMDLRWTVPRPPTNQIGVKDKSGDETSIQLPAAQGTTRVTKIPIEIPTLPDGFRTDMPIKLQVSGHIGGNEYMDEFIISHQNARMLRA